jgi:FtsZ-interacting cell division protein YlmF
MNVIPPSGGGDARPNDREQGEHVSVLHRIGAFFSLGEEEADADEAMPPAPPPKAKVVSFSAREASRAGNPEVAVFAPRAFGDVTHIADGLRSRQVVIVNLQHADRGLLQRIVDFTSGVAYTLEGKIQKLAEGMYLVVPAGVQVNAQGLREQFGVDPLIDFMNRG